MAKAQPKKTSAERISEFVKKYHSHPDGYSYREEPKVIRAMREALLKLIALEVAEKQTVKAPAPASASPAPRREPSLSELAWKVSRFFNIDQNVFEPYAAMVSVIADGSLKINEQTLLRLMEDRWRKLTAHPQCKDHFMEYGSLSYSTSGEDRCPVCGDLLWCNGEIQRHDYQELTQAECARRKITHHGRCWHVSECKRCGVIQSVDSSD